MKKTRLFEIIREEISYVLNEIPFIDSPIDITLKNPEKEPNPENIEDNALQKAINNAVEVLKKENSDISDSELISTIMKSNTPKNLEGGKFSPEVTNALKGIRDVISKQANIFNSNKILKSLMGSKGLDPKAIKIIGKYIDGSKSFTDNLGKNQTETAIEKALGKKDTKNQSLFTSSTTTTKKPSTGKRGRPAGKVTKTKAAGVDDEGNKVEIDTNIQTPTGDTDIETKLKSVISAKKSKLKKAKEGSLEYEKELAALKQFLDGKNIKKYINKKKVGDNNPYSISNILKDIE